MIIATDNCFRKNTNLPDINICNNAVKCVSKVRNLGGIFDKTLRMQDEVNHTIKSAIYAMRGIRKVRKVVPLSTVKTLVVTLVISRII